MQLGLENKFSSLTFTLVMSSVSAVCNVDGVGYYIDTAWRKT